MRLTQRERDNPIGKAKASPLFMEEETVRVTQADIAAQYAVQPTSITNFRRRHPEVTLWTDEQVARQLEINRNKKVRRLLTYTRPPTIADLAESRGVNKWDMWWKRVRRGADPMDAARPDYKKRSKWDDKRTLKAMCKEAGVHRDSVRQWKRKHPGHDKSDAQIVQIIKRNKEKRHERSSAERAGRHSQGARPLEEAEPRTEGGE